MPVSEEEADKLANAVLAQHGSDRNEKVRLGSWTIVSAAVGGNGVVWRATNADGISLAIKLSVVDSHRRGTRELAATRRLAESGLDIAPRPICLVEHEDVTVLVSEWLDGRGFDIPPEASSPLWDRFISTFAAIHRVDADDLLEARSASLSGLDVALEHAKRLGRHRFPALVAGGPTESRRSASGPASSHP